MQNFLNLSLILAVSATALAVSACGVDYTSLGERPVEEGGGGGAGGGGGGGASGGAVGDSSPGVLCTEPNPVGCGENNPCGAGSLCVETAPQGCTPSRCDCGESGYWACTKDCVTPHACVAAAPAIGSVECASLVYDPTVSLKINVAERACSAAVAYPHLEVALDLGENLNPAGRTFTISPTESALAGSYIQSADVSKSVSVVLGSLEVISWDETKGTTGRYEFLLADGARVSGYFDATLCPSTVQCLAPAIELDLERPGPRSRERRAAR